MNHSFIIWGQNEKSWQGRPASFNNRENKMQNHLVLLPLLIVIVTVKVKVIIKKR